MKSCRADGGGEHVDLLADLFDDLFPHPSITHQ
jgi:hypothetical protein